jgi:uncharacterized protein (TIGR00269 family)
MVSKNPKACEICGEKSAISLLYGPHYFCEKHFTKFFDNRIRKTIRKYSLLGSKEKILVALSGGKDSTVVLYILQKYYSKSHTIEAIIIDEGVKGYREKAIKSAVDNCKKWKIKHHIISFKKEFGITNDQLMPVLESNKKLGGTCAFCGTLRRNIMNKYAKKYGADKLVTGHNLDDDVQSFVMNVFNNDFNRMKRMGATAGIIEHDGFVKRIKPLYETPEKEIVAYCIYNNLPHYGEECCPYSWTAKRNEFREMLNNFETRFPGTQFSILRFYEELKKEIIPKNKKKLKIKGKLKACEQCGEPTEKKFCKACELITKIKNEQKKNKKSSNKKSLTTSTKYNKKLTCATTKKTK